MTSNEAFVRATRPTRRPRSSLSSPKPNVLLKMIKLTGSSWLEELNRRGTILVNPTTETPAVG